MKGTTEACSNGFATRRHAEDPIWSDGLRSGKLMGAVLEGFKKTIYSVEYPTKVRQNSDFSGVQSEDGVVTSRKDER